MDAHKEGWFTEIGAPKGENVALSILSQEVLHDEKSEFQRIMVFESEIFGKCLALDDAIQCTEMDECSYQEMIAFLPLNSHPKPSRVLVIGGGDGGVARECLKHPAVEKLVQCEIDERVVEVSKMFFPSMAESYDNPKLELVIGDGFEYVKNLPDDSFDVIITDSSDPKGPAAVLFSPEYFALLERKLGVNGIICNQAESMWFDRELIHDLLYLNGQIFKQVAYASTTTCTYPGGQIGFLIACKGDSVAVDLRRPVDPELMGSLNLKYYTAKMHEAAFVLPKFVEDEIY